MQDAPEEKVLEPIRPSLGLETVTYDDDGNPQQEVMAVKHRVREKYFRHKINQFLPAVPF